MSPETKEYVLYSDFVVCNLINLNKVLTASAVLWCSRVCRDPEQYMQDFLH